jgi:hypothetical protein
MLLPCFLSLVVLFGRQVRNPSIALASDGENREGTVSNSAVYSSDVSTAMATFYVCERLDEVAEP